MTLSAALRALYSRHSYGVLALLLLAMLVRGTIPAGYMPDINALRDGRIAITLCLTPGAGASVQEAWVNVWGDADHNESLSAGELECPFGVLGNLAALESASGLSLLGLVLNWLSLPRVTNHALPVMGARGPPLGARAPPAEFFS